MSHTYPLKIDIASHILPVKYKKALDDAAPGHVQQNINNTETAITNQINSATKHQ